MPKDYEKVSLPLPLDGLDDPPPSPFALDEMVRCDECLRANPPTRVNCLYCGIVLPLNETTVNLQKPVLRPLEKWEQGYNNILLPPAANRSEEQLTDLAEFLRLRPDDLGRILASDRPLPLALAATLEEASLIQRRLSSLGITSRIMPDPERDAAGLIKVRALEINDEGVGAYQTPEGRAIRISWADFRLLVVGRLVGRRVELKEQTGARAENRLLDASEFLTDETVVDFYLSTHAAPHRISAKSFDFSCLGKDKSLVADQNISTLVQLFREHAPQLENDDSFTLLRKTLEAVWPSEQRNESSGWRRERPGRYSVGTVTELNNEMQFSRYSRLRYFFLNEALVQPDENA